ncbi:Bud site selection protein 14 [Pseudozyma hubeiensis]|nr:Bud site selection protein 14 [Pseudozyma hubeiensis]
MAAPSVAAQAKPALTLDVNLGSSGLGAIGGSGTSTTPRSHQNAVNNKIHNQVHASTFGPQSDYNPNNDQAYAHDDFEHQPDNGGFSSDEDGQDIYAAATSRLKAGSSSSGALATRDDSHSPAHARLRQQDPNATTDASNHSQRDSVDAYGHDEYAQDQHYHHHQMADGIHDEMVYDDDDDDADEIEDDESDLSSSPSIPDENIDFDLVYALHNFVATVEGQATVHKGNSLTLLDDSNSYWWLVRVLRTQEVGYIPAENIETPFERLARLNKHRNVDLTSATDDDHIQVPERIFTSHLVKARNATGTAGVSMHSGKLSALSRRAQGAPAPLSREQKRTKRGVVFGPSTYLEHSGDEYSDYDEEGEEQDLEYEEDPDAEYDDEDEHDQEQAEYDDGDDQHRDAHAHHRENIGFNKMEPDDGMEWDAQEAERVQQQQQDALLSRGPRDQQTRSISQQAAEAQQQIMSHPYAQQYARAPAGPPQASAEQAQRGNGAPYQQSAPQASRQQPFVAQNQNSADSPMYANGRSSTSSQQLSAAGPNYGALAAGRVPGEHMRTTSAERSISSVTSNCSVIYDSNGRPTSIAMNRTSSSGSGGLPTSAAMNRNSSSSSSGGFLPSQIQRERASSDASANSTILGADASSLSEKDRRKSSRTSKGSDSYDTSDDKAGKKRSGVFSLFSRKDKKDRKSGNFDDKETNLGISSEDAFVGANARGHSSPAANVSSFNPTVQAANAGLQPGQSIGMGRAVQERDRATQEAYVRQFLSPQNSSVDSSHVPSSAGLEDKKRMPQRPGSLIGPSGSTPMLSVLRVFAGEGVDSDSTFKTVLLNDSTRSIDLQRQALQRFGVNLHDADQYVLTIKRLEGDERPLDEDEHPLELFNTLTEILQQGQVTVPSVKRSSVGSISSINSNLSTHPAIARLGNDFSDDHAVKFYISRRDRLQGYVDLSGNHTADVSNRSANVSDLSVSQDNSNLTSLSLVGDENAPSSHSSMLTGETSETVQSATARFALRLIIYSSDLPEGIVFDPQSNALIPAATLRQRMAGRPDALAESASQHRFREKILTFPRNTTVAEVVEEGLDRFGIAEGVVEGGDDVEDRPSRRKSRLHVKYGLAVQAADGERALAPTSKVLEAYPSPPSFKLGIGNRRSTDGKRRSIDAAALLGASDDVGAHDPVFVLRQITHAHSAPRPKQMAHTVGARAHSPTDNVLAAVQETRQTQPLASPRLGGSMDPTQANQAKPNQARTPQEIIAAQRAAAAERNAAVLGAQRNAQQGVDVVLTNQARIRSSKLGSSNKFRYSYVPVDGQERDISSIIEEVMKDHLQSSHDTRATSSADTGLSPRDAERPPYGSRRMQSDLTTDDYASARSSSGADSPLSLDEVNFEVRSPDEIEGGVAPLALGKQRKQAVPAGAQGDLLDTLLRASPQSDAKVEEKINAVLDRVQTPTMSSTAVPSRELTPNGVRSNSAAGAAPTSRAGAVGAGVAAAVVAGAVGAGAAATVVAGMATAGATAAVAHNKQHSVGSEFSNSRDTSSPLTVGTSSAATHATNTTGTMLTPLSNFVPNRQPTGLRSASAPSPGAGSRSVTPSTYPSVAALSFGADDASLSHLYTIVDAAARRDPRRRLLTHASMSSISSATSPILNQSALFGGTGSISGGSGSRPGSKLSSHAVRLQALLEDDRDALKPEPGGLFAPNMPFVEDKKLREAYSGINRQLGDIDDSLDSLLADVIRIF